MNATICACSDCERRTPLIKRGSTRRRKYCASHGEYTQKGRASLAKSRLDRQREVIWELKGEPCMDCGGSFHPCSMQYDHRDPTEKRANVSELWGHSLQTILDEITKCDLLCANCHALRTWLATQES